MDICAVSLPSLLSHPHLGTCRVKADTPHIARVCARIARVIAGAVPLLLEHVELWSLAELEPLSSPCVYVVQLPRVTAAPR